MTNRGKLPPLTVDRLKTAARDYARGLTAAAIEGLYGVTDGKAVGTYVERRFHDYLEEKFLFTRGSAASGIDLPDLAIDLKVTSVRQPQSSCPFQDASQKVYGLGYSLLVMVYDKKDDHSARSARLEFQHVIFVAREQTGDYQTTYGLREILRREGNRDDVIAFLEERNLPLDEIGRGQLTDRILREQPRQGHLTISNALQWRLQYGRVIDLASKGRTEGVENLLD